MEYPELFQRGGTLYTDISQNGLVMSNIILCVCVFLNVAIPYYQEAVIRVRGHLRRGHARISSSCRAEGSSWMEGALLWGHLDLGSNSGSTTY